MTMLQDQPDQLAPPTDRPPVPSPRVATAPIEPAPAVARPPLPPPRFTPPGRRRAVTAAMVAGTVAASVAGGALAGHLTSADGAGGASATRVESVAVSSAASAGAIDVGAIVDSLADSVVSVETTAVTRRGPFSQEVDGAGTGVVIGDGGLVLTNAHVVEGADTVTVRLDGDTTARSAEVLAVYTESDVAVIRVADASGLVPAPVATAAAEVGDEVVAIGNALALEGGLSVTKGIVSATDRSIETENGTLTDLVQTDAAISSGNSGGPLVNAAGEVIGINSAVAASSGSVQASNIGFAIAIDRALEVAADAL